MNVEGATRIDLPAGVGEDFQVYVNGLAQQSGRDFDRVGAVLVFRRSLEREGRLGFLRWASMFLGVAGTYRKNDAVDIVYEHGGRRHVATVTPTI